MITRSAVVLSIVAAGCGSAGQSRGHALVDDQFRYSRGEIVCMMTKRPSANDTYRACLRIGPTRVGDEYAGVEKRAGQPYVSEPVDEGRGQAHIYVLDENPETEAYVAYWESEGKIIAIQLTGRGTVPTLDFAGIHLGDTSAQLVDTLGPAHFVERNPGYELWSYRPYPFSMEVRGGRVYSIKVWGPDHAPCACGKPGCCGGVETQP